MSAKTGVSPISHCNYTTTTNDETHDSAQQRQREKLPEGGDTRAGNMATRLRKWTANSMIAGAGGGLVSSIATCPLDVIKTKLQAQRAVVGQPGYLGVSDTIHKILREDGIRGFYRGLGPTILGYLPTWAIYFAVYDGIKTYFGQPPLGVTPSTASYSGTHTPDRLYPAAQVKGYQPVIREHPWSLHILSAMVAGATSTMCTNPLWFIKTRFMTQSRDEVRYRHTLDAAIRIFRTEGIGAFYRGLLPSLLGILHVAVQFPLYEQLKAMARKRSVSLAVLLRYTSRRRKGLKQATI
ncbi:hypothetical protein AX15_001037 [Amanita polypyramis BW_CC]|nr:hypothetical protein AX15_001037 [Amanita polypyramis BW_CC]